MPPVKFQTFSIGSLVKFNQDIYKKTYPTWNEKGRRHEHNSDDVVSIMILQSTETEFADCMIVHANGDLVFASFRPECIEAVK